LASILRAYTTLEKITTKKIPFYLTYGLDSIVPSIEFEYPTFQILMDQRMGVEKSNQHTLRWFELIEEHKDATLEETYREQFKRKTTYDKPSYKNEGLSYEH
jgi:hypothetical protein